MRVQAKFSAGNDYLQFLLVSSGNLPAAASKLREAYSVPVRVEFFKPSDILYLVPNNLIKVSIYCL